MTVDTVSKDLIAALKAGDKPKAEALRLLKSALTNARIAAGHELNEEEIIKVIRKEMKSRIEARDMFRQNDRRAQADQEELERQVYSAYVPAELSDEQLSELIKSVVNQAGDNLQFGQLMGQAIKLAGGKADGSRISAELKKQLGQG